MNHCVPELSIGDEDHSPSASALPGQNSVQDDVIMELLWRNGQVVVQSQNPRFLNQSSPPPMSNSSAQVSMHEEEMISWLQCPLETPPFGRDINDLLYHPPMPPSSTAPAELRPIPPRPQVLHNFPHFSRMTTGRFGESRNAELRESTVVDSCDTPAVDRESEINLPTMNTVEVYSGGNRGCDSFSGASTLGDGCMSISMSRDGDTYDLMLTSSPDGSAATTTTEYQSEDVEIESYDEKKQPSRGNSKRSRAAEVHNLSERRRRDKINKKMRVLQDLIPRCGKTDKASMLDEAIEYLKSLQAQVQMMAMGCGMVPMMFPGAQQYMPAIGMGMSRPMMPYPSQINPRFPPHAAFPVPLVRQPSNQADASLNPIGMPGYNVARAPNPAQPYHQYVGVHRIPMQIPQTEPASQPGTEQQSTSSDDQDDEKHQCELQVKEFRF